MSRLSWRQEQTIKARSRLKHVCGHYIGHQFGQELFPGTLSSAISATQNQWDYLAVLTDAIRSFGAPEAIVTDGGGQFYSTVALQLYDMLGIRKERIDPGQAWENYVRRVGGFGIPAQCRGG